MPEFDFRTLFSYGMALVVVGGGAWAIKKWLGHTAAPSPPPAGSPAARAATGKHLAQKKEEQERRASRSAIPAERPRPLDPVAEAAQSGQSLKAGRLAMEAGDWRLAADHFLEAARPLDAARALRRGELWVEAAQQFEAGKDFQSAAQCYLRAGRKPEALRNLEQTENLSEAAALADEIGDPRKAATVLLRLGRVQDAADRFQRAGEGAKAWTLRAELAERAEQWSTAAQAWAHAQSWDRAMAAFDRAGDDLGAARVLAHMGKREQAADRYMKGGAFADAAALYEAQGIFRKAAMAHQKAGDTERAIRCLTLEGDKIAVIKLRQALGQTDEALRVAQAVSPTDAAYIDAAQIVAVIYLNRGEKAAAARTLLQLLDAPLAPGIKVATGRRAAELFVELRDVARGRQVLDKLASQIAPGSDDERWAMGVQRALLDVPPVTERPPAQHAPSGGSAVPTIAMNLANAETTETLPDEAIAPREETEAYLGGSPVRNGDVPLTTDGWPSGVPLGLADRYGDLERLGQGGNGVVFRAVDKLLGRPVVLKFMIQGTMPSETARKYFLREVKLSASLNHPNIVHIYDMGNTDDVLWYAMEYVDGVPLTAHLAIGQPIKDIVFLMSVVDQLCAALDNAHAQGLVHRDIKPDNVLVANDGTVKLLDFGLARAMDEGFGEQSVLAGTPYYMAPEQLDGSTVDHRADIYALGVVLFRMFTGHLPFSDGNIFVAHAVEPVPDPRRYNRELPAEAVAVVMKAMAKKAQDRYPNCRQIALDVHSALFGHIRHVGEG